MRPAVLFFGGNGHAAARLVPARRALDRLVAAGQVAPFEIVEVRYPGFEGRPRAGDRSAFLAALEGAAAATVADPGALVYATGIGALLALTLRVSGSLGRARVVLQGPVLWGLERRWMPRLARAGLAPVMVRLFRSNAFRRHFEGRYFTSPLSVEDRRGFFEGYDACASAADLFRWCGPSWLREIEAQAGRAPESLEGIEVWWGARDRVVGPSELRWTEKALGVRWAERTFPGWGHYPMIDDPDGWIRALAALRAHEGPAL